MSALIVCEVTKAELDRMVKAALPQMGAYKTEMLKGGLFNTTYLIESDDTGKKYVLRVGPVHRELLLPYEYHLMDAEAWAYGKFAEIGVPSSTVVHIDTSKTLLDRDFMVVEYIPSKGLDHRNYSDEDNAGIYREVGRYCRMMADIKAEKFGRVTNVIRGNGSDTWSGYIKRELSEWADCIRRNTTDYYIEEELTEIVSLADDFSDILDEIKTPCFCHCDMWSLNVLMKPDSSPEIAAIIDPDRACMGDPDFELASGWMVNDAYLEGYGRRPASDRSTKIRVLLYQMIYCILNGYIMWAQFDDKNSAAGDKERGGKCLERLREYRDGIR